MIAFAAVEIATQANPNSLISVRDPEQVMKIRRAFDQVRRGMNRDEVIKKIGKPLMGEVDRWENRQDYYFRPGSAAMEGMKNTAIRFDYDHEGKLLWRTLDPVFHVRLAEMTNSIRLGLTRQEVVQAFGFSPHRFHRTLYDPPVKLSSGDGGRGRNGLRMSREDRYYAVTSAESRTNSPMNELRVFYAPDDRIVHWRIESYCGKNRTTLHSECAKGDPHAKEIRTQRSKSAPLIG